MTWSTQTGKPATSLGGPQSAGFESGQVWVESKRSTCRQPPAGVLNGGPSWWASTPTTMSGRPSPSMSCSTGDDQIESRMNLGQPGLLTPVAPSST